MFNEKKTKNDSSKEESLTIGIDLSNAPDVSLESASVKTEFADVISSKPLNFRDKPDGKILATLKKGTKLEIKGLSGIAKDKKWVNVVYNGINGWVVSEYLGPTYVEVKTDGQHPDDN